MANKFKEKQYTAEILGELYAEVENREASIKCDYRPIGKKQEYDWRTHDYVWEDEEKTIPHMVDDWGNVPKEDDELTDEDKMKLRVCQQIKAALEKLI